jgi:TatD DNase family protein
MFIDSHCHLDFPELRARLPEVLATMREQHVDIALCISVSLEGFPRVLELATEHSNLYASVGVHPEHAPFGEDEDREGHPVKEPDVSLLTGLANHPRVIAIGETGLDYYWNKEEVPGSLEWQRNRFRVHIRAACETRKPLVIHTRNAAEDTLRIMKEEASGPIDGGPGGVMHCFTESWDVARSALDLGFYISFSGIVTFKSATALKDVATRVPMNRILIETDAPYLAPVPKRGKTNEPGFVPFVAAEIARLRGLSIEEVAEHTTQNFHDLFCV